ncbi:MAG: hypothetical protein ACLSHG_04300 [Oscillospiraceae bacterium]
MRAVCGARGLRRPVPDRRAQARPHRQRAIAGWSGASDIGRSKHLIVTDKDLFTARNISIESIRILGGAFPGKVITMPAA